MMLRVSIGTLAVLGLTKLRMLEPPRTAYVLQHSERGCEAACAFCPQSKFSSSDKNLLSRIPWPPMEVDKVVEKLGEREDYFCRICLQNVLKPRFEKELIEILQKFRRAGIVLPVSICTTPVSTDVLRSFKRLGVDYVGVGLDAASPEVLRAVRKPYGWKVYWNFIRRSIKVFGYRKVNVHLMFGLGESEEEFAKTMQNIYDEEAEVALFPFTPISGTPMEKKPMPQIERYRVTQITRFLLSKRYRLEEIADEKNDGKIYVQNHGWVSDVKKVFLTSGCPGCNRPFYNERPNLIYNYPSVRLLLKNLDTLNSQLESVGFPPEG
jgi:biotin synthase-related radical SAM superfamily protein